MEQIRCNTFETNSSSTHSICIPKKTNMKSQHIKFTIKDFGWSNDHIKDTASYLYTAILSGYGYEESTNLIAQLAKILNKNGISYSFEKPKWVTYEDSGAKYLDDESGYLDHAYEARSFVDAILNDEEMLLRFLADGDVYTGNDNQDCCMPNGCDIAFDTYYDEEKHKEVVNPYHDEENYDYFFKGN